MLLSEDSFATVEYADEYFSMQIGGEEWATYDLDLKEKALNSGYSQIVIYCEWEWDEVPESVKIAQCELAYNLAKIQSGTLEAEAEQALKKLKAGPVELQFYNEEEEQAGEDNLFTDYIKKLLSKDCTCTFDSETYLGTVEF